MAEYCGEDNLEVMEAAEKYNEFLISLIVSACPDKNKKIVDLGAGNGLFAKALRNSGYKDILCVEPADGLSAGLRMQGFACVSKIDEVVTGSVDFLYCLNVLEHIEDDKRAGREIYRCLKKGGGALVYVPAFSCLFSAMDKKVGHYRRYTRKTLLQLFEPDNWKIEQAEYADILGFGAALFFRFFGNKRGDLNRRGLLFYDRWIFPFSRMLDFLGARMFAGKNVYVRLRKNSRNMCQNEIKKIKNPDI